MALPHRQADADRRLHTLAAKVERARKLAADGLGCGERGFGVVDVLNEDGKFITAKPGDRVAVRNKRTKACGNLDQELIADRMAKAVVNKFEAVKVDVTNSKALVFSALCRSKRSLQTLHKERAIWQSRQSVMQSVKSDLPFGTFAVVDVLKLVNVLRSVVTRCRYHRRRPQNPRDLAVAS